MYMPNGDANNWWPTVGHLIGFGAAVSNGWTWGAILTPQEALSMDSKSDDGLPASGKMMTLESTEEPNCTTSNTQASAQYKTSYSGPACNMMFLTGF